MAKLDFEKVVYPIDVDNKVYIENLLSSSYEHLKIETLCKTVDNRECKILTITNIENFAKVAETADILSSISDSKKKSKSRKDDTTDEFDTDDIIKDEEEDNDYYEDDVRVIFIMGRQSASDSLSSFIIQGLIDFLTSSHSIAEALRKRLIFKIIPIMNPDGVFYGNSRTNAIGQDLNRLWNNTNKYTSPSIHKAKKLIVSLDKVGLLDMVIDIHAHASLLGLFITGNSYSDVYRFERHIVFPKFLAKNCVEMNLENNKYNEDPLMEGTARRYLTSVLSSEVNVYSLEASVYGYASPEIDDGEKRIYTFNNEQYSRIGQNVCRALWDYYKIIGFIPMDGFDGSSSHGKINLYSFNLLRMREIDLQRQQAFLTEEQEQENYFPSEYSSPGSNESISPRLKISITPIEHFFDDHQVRRSSCPKASSITTYRISPRKIHIPLYSKNIPPAPLNKRPPSSDKIKRRPSDFTLTFNPSIRSNTLESNLSTASKDIIPIGEDLLQEEHPKDLRYKRKITLRPPSHIDTGS
ncbi:AGBL4 [Lepeophtheirus salmonis]|uniref:AGBL4 n=1 Tax=Lepeophtheirus salmonis TaxID=72036 RepID=A0A7R8H6L5_LEPSM|nr:AGBL4 [Lepeophtheirus salmonis]CAF2899267.1 AGBL4 [Lepeophtheirus salmonis]